MNIVINGGTKGIGREIALQLSGDKNNKILVTGRDVTALGKLSSGAENGNIIAFRLDLSDYQKYKKEFLNAVRSWSDGIDILINTAGLVIVKDFMDFSPDQARVIMETNFFGPAEVIRTLQPIMKRGSHIVNISSMGGFQGSIKYKGLSHYSASKAALAGLSECLAGEFREYDISVNCLALGSVQTEMFEEAFPGLKADVSAGDMAAYIADFAIRGHKYFNGKVLPVATGNPK